MSNLNVLPRNLFSLENFLPVVEKLIMVRNKLAKYMEQLLKKQTPPNKGKHVRISNLGLEKSQMKVNLV